LGRGKRKNLIHSSGGRAVYNKMAVLDVKLSNERGNKIIYGMTGKKESNAWLEEKMGQRARKKVVRAGGPAD